VVYFLFFSKRALAPQCYRRDCRNFKEWLFHGNFKHNFANVWIPKGLNGIACLHDIAGTGQYSSLG